MCPPGRLSRRCKSLESCSREARTSKPRPHNISKPSPLPVSEYLFADPSSTRASLRSALPVTARFQDWPRSEKVGLLKLEELYAAARNDVDYSFPANQTAENQTFCHQHPSAQGHNQLRPSLPSRPIPAIQKKPPDDAKPWSLIIDTPLELPL